METISRYIGVPIGKKHVKEGVTIGKKKIIVAWGEKVISWTTHPTHHKLFLAK